MRRGAHGPQGDRDGDVLLRPLARDVDLLDHEQPLLDHQPLLDERDDAAVAFLAGRRGEIDRSVHRDTLDPQNAALDRFLDVYTRAGGDVDDLGFAASLIDAGSRNTASPTVLAAGGKANVIPAWASATLDVRVVPGQAEAVREQLAAVVGEASLPRGEVVSKVWEYIKKHELQNPENKREILADDKLKKVFGKDKCTMFEMNKHLAAHLKSA